MVVVSRSEGLPVRDADGILGGRIAMLIGTIALFLSIDVLPRAARRTGWRREGLWSAILEVRAERWTLRRLAIVVLGIVAFYGTYFAYRNLKSFLPLITPQDLDGRMSQWEDSFFGANPGDLLHSVLGTGIAAQILSTDYLFFLAFVPISLGVSLIASINPLPGVWWVTALGVNWILGTVSYYLVPTMGPVFYQPAAYADLPVTGVSRLQDALLVQRYQALASPETSHVVQSIAGFASLHASVTLSAALIATMLGLHRILRIALWAFFAITLVATVYFGWHYVLDDVAGLVIGVIAVVVSALVTGNRAALRRRTRTA
jgi:membrane-associated phospholipid phosphatase